MGRMGSCREAGQRGILHGVRGCENRFQMSSHKRLILTAGILAMAANLAPAQTPSPALLVLNKEGTLAIVDPSTRKVMGRVPTGDSPHEVVASIDGKLAFASNYGGGTPGHPLSPIDPPTHTELPP